MGRGGNEKKNSSSSRREKEGVKRERSAAGESPLVAVDTCPLGEGEGEERVVICLARKEVQFL